MGENELGLKKAILSGEDDLVYLAVMHIEREAGSSEKGREAFFELMHAHPEALRLLKVNTIKYLSLWCMCESKLAKKRGRSLFHQTLTERC